MSDSPVPTLREMLLRLSEVGSDWFVFSIALGVPIRKLREIEITHSKEGAMRCIAEAAQYWLESTPVAIASWRHVATALEQVGLSRLASIIKLLYFPIDEGLCVAGPGDSMFGGFGGFQKSGPCGTQIFMNGSDGMNHFGFEQMNFENCGSWRVKDEPIHRDVHVSLEELAIGCTKKLKINKQVLSPDGTSQREVKILTIDIEPGQKEGTKFTFPEEGDQTPGHIPADIVFTIKQKPHPLFTREGDNLKYTVSIPLKKALLGKGTYVQIPTLTGGCVPITLPGIINPKTELTVPGHGLPTKRSSQIRGDLIVTFDIAFPRSLAPANMSLLMDALP